MPDTKQLMSAIESEPLWKLSKLLKKMDLAEINGKENGETSLHLACRGQYNEAVDLLVDKNGVDVNAKNDRGGTPLHVAVANKNVHAVTKILTNPQVYVNVQDNCGRTPLHYACARDYQFRNHHQIHQMMLELLASPGIDVNVRCTDGFTPVMLSALTCNVEALKLMLEDTRVDVNAEDEDGEGLEMLVGCVRGDAETKEKCLEMIGNKRRNREHYKVEKEKQSQAGNVGQPIDKLKNFYIGNKEGNGEESGGGNLETVDEQLVEGNDGEVKEEGSKATVNEDIKEENGEKEKGSVATGNEPKEENKNKEIDPSKLCWFCSKEDCKLYKCGGCRKARYCSDECITKDWKEHGSWCMKEQQRRNKATAENQEAKRELESPLDLE